MTVRHGIYPAALGWDNASAQAYLNLKQLESVSFTPGAQMSQTIPGGALDPAEHIVGSIASSVEFTTRDLHALLTANATILTTGFCLKHVSGDTAESYIVHQERADCGSEAARRPGFLRHKEAPLATYWVDSCA